MRYGLLLVFIGSIFFTIAPTAQAGMKDFCAIRWHDNAAMQQYCLAVQDQSTKRLAKLLDILEATHERLRASGENPATDIPQRCSRQHHIKVFDAYHNQLVEVCLVQYLDRLQQPRGIYQQHAQLDEF